MLTLAFSVLLVSYLIIPEAIFRFIFGLFIPTKALILTRIEKAFRAVLLALIPFSLALALSWYVPGPDRWPFPVEQNRAELRRTDYKLVASAFYSETEYRNSKAEFWPALTRTTRRQVRLTCWYYLLVVLEAWGLGKLASQYDKLRVNRFYKWFADSFLSAYISQWHPLLTLRDKEIQADILCTNETLYQGNVSQYFLKDGELSGIILDKPRRFNRALFHKAKDEGKMPEKKDYWISIPSKHMYFFVDKILNMNLTYITTSTEITDSTAVEKFLTAEFGSLKVSVKGEQKVSPHTHQKKN